MFYFDLSTSIYSETFRQMLVRFEERAAKCSNIWGTTRKVVEVKSFGLLGEKLGHSFSPSIHWMLGSYPYELCQVPPAGLEDFRRTTGLTGFNVTIPTNRIIPLHTAVSFQRGPLPSGSVNTMLKKRDGSYFGENTDYDGFLLMMEPVKG